MIFSSRFSFYSTIALVIAIFIVLLLYFLNVNNEPSEENLRLDKIDFQQDDIVDRDEQVLIKNVYSDEYQSDFGPLANSLAGTYVPIHLAVASDGQLVITSSIKILIEYFLSANAEESIAVIKGRIEEVFDRNLTEPANSQAKSVLAQYFEYKTALAEVEAQLAENQVLSNQASDYQNILAERRETRLAYLDQAVYDEFYLAEDSQDNYTAAMLELNKNLQLSAAEKKQQALELISLLPPKEQAIKRQESQRQDLQQEVSEARALGASTEEIYQMRTRVYDPDTAERFSKRDKEQNVWDRRFSNYRQQRQRIIDGDGLSESDKNDEILALEKTLFNDKEQRRLETLNRMADEIH